MFEAINVEVNGMNSVFEGLKGIGVAEKDVYEFKKYLQTKAYDYQTIVNDISKPDESSIKQFFG